MFRRVSMIGLVLFSALACADDTVPRSGGGGGGGGGPSCYAICAEEQQCPGAVTEDCTTSCQEVMAFSAESGCSAALGTLLRCLDAEEDICAPGLCVTEDDAYDDCADDYCEVTPISLACGGPGDPLGLVPQCLDLCEEAESCPGADPIDCESECPEGVEMAYEYGCETEYEDILDCADAVPDICADDNCPDEGEAFVDCFSGY